MSHRTKPSWGRPIGVGLLAGALIGGKVLSEGAPVALALFAGVAAAVAVTLIAYAAETTRLRRTAEFAELARKNGWVHQADVKGGVVTEAGRCKPYTNGRGATAEQLLSGRVDGVPFHILAGEYTTGGGRSKQVHRVSSVAVAMPFELLMTIEPETLGHKLKDALGGEDIDVESDEFSRRFWVRSTNRRKAYDVLHPRAIEFLLGLKGTWVWDWNGPFLLMTTPKRLQPADCQALLQQALAFRALVPRHLREPDVPPQWRRAA